MPDAETANRDAQRISPSRLSETLFLDLPFGAREILSAKPPGFLRCAVAGELGRRIQTFGARSSSIETQGGLSHALGLPERWGKECAGRRASGPELGRAEHLLAERGRQPLGCAGRFHHQTDEEVLLPFARARVPSRSSAFCQSRNDPR